MKNFIYEGPVRIIYGAGQYKELKENPHDRKKLMEITTEKLADIIEEAIEGLA